MKVKTRIATLPSASGRPMQRLSQWSGEGRDTAKFVGALAAAEWRNFARTPARFMKYLLNY